MGHLKHENKNKIWIWTVLCYVGHVSECVLFSPLLLIDVYQRWIHYKFPWVQLNWRERERQCVCVCEYLNIFLTKDYPELECHAKRLLFLVLTSQADLIKMWPFQTYWTADYFAMNLSVLVYYHHKPNHLVKACTVVHSHRSQWKFKTEMQLNYVLTFC